MVTTSNTSPIKKIDRQIMRRLAARVWQNYSREKSAVSLNFVSVREIVNLNKTYLHKDTPTDVIAFNLGKGPEAQVIADIYVCPEVASQNAAHYSCELNTELARLVIHGMLHVIGFNDASEGERAEMRELEEKFLKEYAGIFQDGKKRASQRSNIRQVDHHH